MGKKITLAGMVCAIIFGLAGLAWKVQAVAAQYSKQEKKEEVFTVYKRVKPLEVNVSVGERKTNEDQYQKVEAQLMKDHEAFEQLASDFDQLHEDFQAHDFLGENVQVDGPNYEETFFYLESTGNELQRIKQEVKDLLSEEQIAKRSEDLQVTQEFMDLYERTFDENFSYLNMEFNTNMPKQTEALRNIFLYLKEHQDRWAVYQKGIIFDKQEYVDGYKELLQIFADIQPTDHEEG